jgi:protein gp37
MAPRKPNNDGAWWDWTWNTMGGCRLISRGCLNCYAARNAGTLHSDLDVQLYRDTTRLKGGRHVFNGTLHNRPAGDPEWTFPLRWPSAAQPLLGAGKPSLIFVNDMSETFLPGRSTEVIDRTFGMLATSRHIGLILTKRPDRMVEYISSQPRIVQQGWRQKFWLGFSAEDQARFDLRWPAMRALAEAGWVTFVSVAPMLRPVRMPDDFLALGKWVIVAGEQGPHRDCRPMDMEWARALRDQCAPAGVAFLMKQMGRRRPIPPDLRIRQFPAIAS